MGTRTRLVSSALRSVERTLSGVRSLSPGSVAGKATRFFLSRVRRHPYPYYAALRRFAPVLGLKSRGVWIVSRYDEARFVLERPDLFSSSIMQPADATLLGADPPAHTVARGVANRAFAHRSMGALRERVRAMADRLLDDLAAGDGFDLMADYAVPLPIMVIAGVLGVDASRYRDFKRWSQAVVVSATGSEAPEAGLEMATSLEEFDQFFQDLIQARSQSPGEDLISRMLWLGAEGDKLSKRQTLSLCKLLLIAGNETTSNLIGNAMMALLRRPARLREVACDPSLAPALVEEALRFDTPVQFLLRRSTQEVTLAGKDIPRGALVTVVLGSANRDERRFPNPHRFDIRRETAGHLAFGHGPHYCLGASLARMEASVALEALLTRFPNLRAAEDLDRVEWVDSVQLRGPGRLLVRGKPRTAKMMEENHSKLLEEERQWEDS